MSVHVADDYSFSIDDTRSFDEYKSGGVVTLVKQPATLNFVRLWHRSVILCCFNYVDLLEETYNGGTNAIRQCNFTGTLTLECRLYSVKQTSNGKASKRLGISPVVYCSKCNCVSYYYINFVWCRLRATVQVFTSLGYDPVSSKCASKSSAITELAFMRLDRSL